MIRRADQPNQLGTVRHFVIDTHAYITLLQGEPGAEFVARLFRDAAQGSVVLHMSAINVGEVFYTVWRREGRDAARIVVDDLPLAKVHIHDAPLDLALKAAAIKGQYPVAYAACFAAALAQELGAAVVTGDPEFRQLEGIIKVQWL